MLRQTSAGATLEHTSRPSSTSDSPALTRKASKRIVATDGTLILDKYIQRAKSFEDESSGII